MLVASLLFIDVSPNPGDQKPTTSSIPLVSQTQYVNNDNHPLDDDVNGQVVMYKCEGDFDSLITVLNNQFDRGEDDPSTEMVDIVAHRYISGILELQVEYTTDECS